MRTKASTVPSNSLDSRLKIVMYPVSDGRVMVEVGQNAGICSVVDLLYAIADVSPGAFLSGTFRELSEKLEKEPLQWQNRVRINKNGWTDDEATVVGNDDVGYIVTSVWSPEVGNEYLLAASSLVSDEERRSELQGKIAELEAEMRELG